MPTEENIASDPVKEAAPPRTACDAATFRICRQDSLKMKEKKKQIKHLRLKNDENTLKIVVETECIGELGPSNTLLRANGSVDNLFLHRRRDRFTLTAYWNCNLAVSMTIGTTSSMANSESRRTM